MRKIYNTKSPLMRALFEGRIWEDENDIVRKKDERVEYV